jgi:hypothetical protein
MSLIGQYLLSFQLFYMSSKLDKFQKTNPLKILERKKVTNTLHKAGLHGTGNLITKSLNYQITLLPNHLTTKSLNY